MGKVKKMELNDYQKRAEETAIYPNHLNVIYPIIGLAGETGEVSEKVKKVLRDNEGRFTDEQRQELAKELGDVLWYVAVLARDLGYSLETVAKMNIDKLQSRKDRGCLGGNGDNR